MSVTVFPEPPSDFASTVQVVGVFCEVGDKYLFLKKVAGSENGALWGLPAGKVEPGEPLDDAALREVREETGLELERERLEEVRSVYVKGKSDFVFHMYRYRLLEEPASIVLSPSEHDAWRWVTLDEAEQLERIPGGREAIHLVHNLLQ